MKLQNLFNAFFSTSGHHHSCLFGYVYVCVSQVGVCLSCCMWWCHVLGSTPSRGPLVAALLSPPTRTTSARTLLTSRPEAYPGTYPPDLGMDDFDSPRPPAQLVYPIATS